MIYLFVLTMDKVHVQSLYCLAVRVNLDCGHQPQAALKPAASGTNHNTATSAAIRAGQAVFLQLNYTMYVFNLTIKSITLF